jgi:hypothetical protein
MIFNAKALALACAILWGAAVLLVARSLHGDISSA